MIKAPPERERTLRTETLTTDLCVVGGGLAGTCAAITAARGGIKVVLIQDRPVLGGNASSEVRLWALGATSHMGNNNRWAREGGLINELLTENLYRNPEGNPVLFDALLYEKATAEPNLTLLLNTAVFEVVKHSESRIESVSAFNSLLNSTKYQVHAPLFLDASGDGIVGFLAGAAFRIGQESRDEFGEPYAPEKPSTDLLGHTLYFMSKDVGRPVRFIPPANALSMDEVRRIRRYRGFDSTAQACQFWWFEYGGYLDTIHASETIKQELWRVVYGVWNYIKNSGEFPEAENLTLEWVGQIPGKRESRRFEGDYMLIQQDVIEQRTHPDAVSVGGWSLDHHPVKGLYSEAPACTQWHSKGVYQIPYRTMYSRNIENLFLGGRIISVSHVAFGSTRVMLTCAQAGQAVGTAAVLCTQEKQLPRDLLKPDRMRRLQLQLLRDGQYIPHIELKDPENLAGSAEITASTTRKLDVLPADGPWMTLTDAQAIMLPVRPGPMPEVTYRLSAASNTTLHAELRVSSKQDNHTPDVVLERIELPITAGEDQPVRLRFKSQIEQACYAFVCLMPNPDIDVRMSEERLTGILTVHRAANEKVAKGTLQDPPPGIGVDRFEFWIPRRRPDGHNPAITLAPPIPCFNVDNIGNGWLRPTHQPNAWVPERNDPNPSLTLTWPSPQTLSRIVLCFDGDFDHAMETVLWGHPERQVPFCVSQYRIRDASGNVLAMVTDNHHAQNTIHLEKPITTSKLVIDQLATESNISPSIIDIRCY